MPTTQQSQGNTPQYQINNISETARPISNFITPLPRCQLQCRCCAVQLTYGLICSCNLPKESVGTQTDNMVLNITAEDYFKPKTTAYKLLKVRNIYELTCILPYESIWFCLLNILILTNIMRTVHAQALPTSNIKYLILTCANDTECY